MKKLFIAVFLLTVFVPVYGQWLNVSTEWNYSFNYGNNGTSDQGHAIVLDGEGNSFISGKNSFLNCAAIMKRNSQGNFLWSFSDSLTATISGQGSIFYLASKGKVGYFTGGAGGNWVVIRDATTGNLIQKIAKNVQYGFAPYGVGDSVVAIETGNSDVVLVMDEYMNVGRQFPIGENVSGYREVRLLGNYIWLVGGYLSTKAFVAKYNFATGQQLWRLNVSNNMNQPRIDIDSVGNSYFACTEKDSINFFYRYRVVKISSNGGILWDKKSKPNPQWDSTGNINNHINSICVSLRGGIVAVGGDIQRNQTNDGWKSAYLLLRKASNGDSVYAEKFTNNPNVQINGIRQMVFRPYPNESKLLVLGFQVIGQNPIFLKQYIADTLVTTIDPKGEIPQKFDLNQNYPNPFNPVTRIEYSIPKKDFVNLRVYDILGKEVCILVSGIKDAGNHFVDFDGKDLPSGIYFCRMEAGSFTDTKKMMLIK